MTRESTDWLVGTDTDARTESIWPLDCTLLLETSSHALPSSCLSSLASFFATTSLSSSCTSAGNPSPFGAFDSPLFPHLQPRQTWAGRGFGEG